MTTHEQQRVMGLLRGDPKWDRDSNNSIWHKGRAGAYLKDGSRPRYYDLDDCQIVLITDPAEVEEYRQGYRVGREQRERDESREKGYADGLYGAEFHPVRFDLDRYQYVPTTDPAAVEEYRQGYRAGQANREKHDHT